MTVPNGHTSPVATAQEAFTAALLADLHAHAAHLRAQGCPDVTDHAVADLWAHVRRHATPELDPLAARLVKRALDLGWRPVTAPAAPDEFGTPPMFQDA